MRSLEAIAEQLVRLGVRDVFTFTASDVVELVAELSLRGVKVHHTRHEHVAVGMADGYSRAGGGVGVAIVGAGVGLTNCLNALLTAAKAHSRVLVLAGEVPGGTTEAAKLQRKYSNQRDLLDALDVRHVDLDSAESVGADTRSCYELVERGDELVVANMPDEILQSAAGNGPSRIQVDLIDAAELSETDREAILSLLADSWTSRHTVIVAGRGAVRAGAREDLLRLAEATGALLGTTLMAKEYFAGSPYSIGVVGGCATPVASELLNKADLVLSFGASLNYETTYDATIFGKARIIQIDNNPAALGRFQTVELPVLADAHLAAARLASDLEAKQHHVEGYRTDGIADRIANFHMRDTFTDRSGPEGIDLRALLTELDRRLPAQRTVVVDGGTQRKYPVLHLSVPDPTGFLWPIGYGAIGCSLGNALGAAVARPERVTVVCLGDGALMMTLADLDTATRYRLPLLVVVSNNSALGAEFHELKDKGYTGDEVRYENPSFEQVARSLGFRAATITRINDLDVLDEMLAESRGPILLDCKVMLELLEPRATNFARERARRLAREHLETAPVG